MKCAEFASPTAMYMPMLADSQIENLKPYFAGIHQFCPASGVSRYNFYVKILVINGWMKCVTNYYAQFTAVIFIIFGVKTCVKIRQNWSTMCGFDIKAALEYIVNWLILFICVSNAKRKKDPPISFGAKTNTTDNFSSNLHSKKYNPSAFYRKICALFA